MKLSRRGQQVAPHMGEGKALRESANKKEDIVKGSYLSARELAQEWGLSQKEEL